MQILYTPLSKIVSVTINNNNNKYFIYTAKNRSAEYEKTAGMNLCAVIEYFKIKKKKDKKTTVHGKRAERLIFTIKKVLKITMN